MPAVMAIFSTHRFERVSCSHFLGDPESFADSDHNYKTADGKPYEVSQDAVRFNHPTSIVCQRYSDGQSEEDGFSHSQCYVLNYGFIVMVKSKAYSLNSGIWDSLQRSNMLMAVVQ